jgi:Flp pilus assembly protein TadG
MSFPPHITRKNVSIFLRCRHGAAALEFAIMTPVFIGFVIAIIQLGLNYFVQSIIDRIAYSSAISIRTGAPQAANLTQAQFQSTIACSYLPAFLNCSNLLVRVWTDTGARNLGGWIYNSNFPSSPNAWCTINFLSYYLDSNKITNCIAPTSATQLYCPGPASAAIMVQIAYPIPFASKIWAPSGLSSKYFLSTIISVNDAFTTSYTNPSGC